MPVMAGVKRNKSETIRTQVSLDPDLDTMVSLLANYPATYGPNKNDVIVGIVREFYRERFQNTLEQAKKLKNFSKKMDDESPNKIKG